VAIETGGSVNPSAPHKGTTEKNPQMSSGEKGNSNMLDGPCPMRCRMIPCPGRRYSLVSLYDVLRNYSEIYKIALELERLRRGAEVFRGLESQVAPHDSKAFEILLQTIQRMCLDYGFTHTSELAQRIISRSLPKTEDEMFYALTHLNDSLSSELERESLFRIPLERKDYFERDDLFGPKVATAFPSCARDIQKAGSCYALGLEDACVHHLMLVLERGLHTLAAKVGVSYERTNWQTIINEIAKRLQSLKRGAEREFYEEVNAQFGFLKVAYRNHSEHAHDDPYDMEKALSILNHVRGFMQALEKGKLSE
jgi:hypothetical protein